MSSKLQPAVFLLLIGTLNVQHLSAEESDVIQFDLRPTAEAISVDGASGDAHSRLVEIPLVLSSMIASPRVPNIWDAVKNVLFFIGT